MSITSLKLELRVREVGPRPSNAFALICPQTRQSVLIDPGDDPDILKDMLAESTPIAILITHAHYLHIHALDAMRDMLRVPVLAHPGPRPMEIVVDRCFDDGDEFQVGEHTLKVIYLPGHTPDLVGYAIQDDTRIVLSDALFSEGQLWSGEDAQQMLDSIEHIVFPWPDSTICYTGHGPQFRLGDRRAIIHQMIKQRRAELFGNVEWSIT